VKHSHILRGGKVWADGESVVGFGANNLSVVPGIALPEGGHTQCLSGNAAS